MKSKAASLNLSDLLLQAGVSNCWTRIWNGGMVEWKMEWNSECSYS